MGFTARSTRTAMMRFLSILLLLAGLVVAGFGGARLLENYRPKAEMATPAVADAAIEMEATEAPAAAAEDDVVVETASVPSATRSLSPPGDEVLFTTEGAGMAAMPPEDETVAGIAVAPDAMAAAPSNGFMESLKTVPVAHETPSTAEYKRPFEAVLAINATGDETAVDALPGHGNIEEGTAQVSKTVEARLSGSGFAIKAMTPEQQTISPLTENTWRWSVTPLTAGNQELTFDIYAIDDGPAVPLRTFHNTVTVQVTGLNRAIAFADQANPLAVFLGGVGSVLAGLFGAVRFVRKR